MYTCKCSRQFEKSQSLNSHQRWCIVARGGEENINKTTFNGKIPKHKGKTFEEHFGDRVAEVKKNLSVAMLKADHPPVTDAAKLSYSIAATNRKVKHVEWFRVGDIKVQGNWEKQVCEYLLAKGFSLDRHAIRFDQTRHYTPDVYVPELDTYIEVKGWMMERDLQKYRKFCDQHPDLLIRLIIGKDYQKFIDGQFEINDLPLLKDYIRK